MDREATTDGGTARPDWREPALRCGLEVVLIGLIAAYLWIQVQSPILSGAVAVAGGLAAVVVLFWSVKEHTVAWIRYASARSRRRRKQRERKRRQRRRQQSGESE